MLCKNVGQNKNQIPALISIFGEFKYRVLYFGLVFLFLSGLIYLNFGLIFEFNGAYYYNYYNFIDFHWKEGLKELKYVYVLSKRENIRSYTEIYHQLLSLTNGDDLNPESYHRLPSSFAIMQRERPSKVEEETLLDIIGNNIVADVERERNPSKAKLAKFGVDLEIDEFKAFFISTLSYFAEPAIFFLDKAPDFNQVLNNPVPGLYFIFSFYQALALLGYNLGAFLGPALDGVHRLKLIGAMLIFYASLVLHFLMHPYLMAFLFELQRESLDSELFYGGELYYFPNNLYGFYFLIIPFLLILSFYFRSTLLKPRFAYIPCNFPNKRRRLNKQKK